MSSATIDFADSASPLRFTQFERLIETRDLAAIPECLAALEAALADGFYAVGFIAYEAAAAFDPALVTRPPDSRLPLLWFGLLRTPHALEAWPSPAEECLMGMGTMLSEADYQQRFERIRQHIRDGDTYQINFTFPLRGELLSSPSSIFDGLRDPARRGYHACIETPDWAIVSASPELFVRRQGTVLTTRPMKGTRPRGRTNEEDEALACELRNSAKDRAENVMIVDLLRNDLGRIALPGSVRPRALFEVERHPGVLQMTSTVEAEIAPQTRLFDILEALFPCGSVTGAPKVQTMRIIAEMEDAPRGVYCGSIGYLKPNGDFTFNVAIRTFSDFAEGLVYPVGSGLVADSTAASEYAECLLKAERASRPLPPFDLLETLLWRPGDGYWLLDRHLERIANSARYWGYPCDVTELRTALADATPGEQSRVRLLLGRDGTVKVEVLPVPEIQPIGSLRVAPQCVNSGNPLLFHKTTARWIYDQAFAHRGNADDALLVNERGEVTEATRANIAALIDGEWLTPALDCGLLAGTLRAELLATGQLRESVITVEQLRTAQEIVALNSVRGRCPVSVEFGDGGGQVVD